jgi:pilus assembly protein Flp/PilA
MLAQIKKLIKDEEAPTAVEYALMVAGVGALIMITVYTLGDSVNAKFTAVDDQLNSR